LHAGAAAALELAASMHRERASGQSSLFGEDEGSLGIAVAPPLPDVPAWTARERGAREKEVLGFYFSGHPLEHLRADIERVATHGISRVLELGDGAEVRVVGLVGEVKQLTTKTGKLMAMVVLEDLTGRVECTLFPEAYEGARAILVPEAIVVASGRVEIREERGAKLLLNEIRPWEDARHQFRSTLHIELRAEDLVRRGPRRAGRGTVVVPGGLRSGAAHREAGSLSHGHALTPVPRRVAGLAHRGAQVARAELPCPLGKGEFVTVWLEFEKPVLELEQKIQELARPRPGARRGRRARDRRTGAQGQRDAPRDLRAAHPLPARADRAASQAAVLARLHRGVLHGLSESCTATGTTPTTRPSSRVWRGLSSGR
jgi:hypothetical protein